MEDLSSSQQVNYMECLKKHQSGQLQLSHLPLRSLPLLPYLLQYHNHSRHHFGLEPFQHGQMETIYKSHIPMWYPIGPTWVLSSAYGNTSREGLPKNGKHWIMITTPYKENLLKSWLQDIK